MICDASEILDEVWSFKDIGFASPILFYLRLLNSIIAN